MKTSNSTEIDGISSAHLKLVKHEVCQVLAELINTSFSVGNFPESFKVAKLTPLWKGKGEKTDKNVQTY